jgi:hypothetical protein
LVYSDTLGLSGVRKSPNHATDGGVDFGGAVVRGHSSNTRMRWRMVNRMRGL